MIKFRLILLMLPVLLIFSCAQKIPISNDDAINSAIEYIKNTEYDPADYAQHILTKEKNALVFDHYEHAWSRLGSEDFIWVACTPQKKGLPIIHLFVDKYSGKVLANIYND